MAPGPIRGEVARQIKLPQTSSRLDRDRTFCQVLTRVSRDAAFSLGFEGRMYRPGSQVERSELPENLVVLECAGAGPMEGRKRQTRWILWRYDDAAGEWLQVGEASALGWEWALVLREPAYELLRPKRGFYDVLELARTVAGEI